jgi:hypothetical protein
MSLKNGEGDDEDLQAAIDCLIDYGCEEQALRRRIAALLNAQPKVDAACVRQLHRSFERLLKGEMARLSKTADGIDHIKSCFYDIYVETWKSASVPGASTLAPDETVLKVLDSLTELSKLIRSHNQTVEKRIKDLKKIFNLKGSGPVCDAMRFGLVEYVRNATGYPNYGLVSEALFGIAQAQGKRRRILKDEEQALERSTNRYRQRLGFEASSDAK